jgi:hypothetical protein
MTVIKALMLAAVLLAVPSPVLAQTKIAIPEHAFYPGGLMKVTITVSKGAQIAKPRFHVVPEGERTPGARSRGWVDFQDMAGTQDVTLRAPAAEGDFWLILNDGGRIVARALFIVIPEGDWFDMKMREADREIERLRESLAQEPVSASPPPETTTQAVRLLNSPSQAPPGATLDVVVRLPADVAHAVDVQLAWATTASLGFVEKERDAVSRRVGSPVTVRASGTQAATVSMQAPAQPGEYDVLLMLGAGLLDAVTVTVR